MTTEKLQEILESDNTLSISEIKQIVYELKNDVIGVSSESDSYARGFYTGEINAFYICLDLLCKLPEDCEEIVRCKDCEFYSKDYPCRHPDDRNPFGCEPFEFCDKGVIRSK